MSTESTYDDEWATESTYGRGEATAPPSLDARLDAVRAEIEDLFCETCRICDAPGLPRGKRICRTCEGE